MQTHGRASFPFNAPSGPALFSDAMTEIVKDGSGGLQTASKTVISNLDIASLVAKSDKDPAFRQLGQTFTTAEASAKTCKI